MLEREHASAFFPSDSDASGSRTLIGYITSQPRIPCAICLAHAASTEGGTDLIRAKLCTRS
jgi:hypothetical protein